jgi:hypothetical protein
MTLALLLALAVHAAPQAPSLAFNMPAGWVGLKPSSSMRVADFTLPKTGADAEDATVTVYYFGGTGGTVQANLDRWIGQMTQPDGRSSRDVARTSTMTSLNGLKITLIDLPGTYVAEVRPGSTERFNKPGFRLKAAVVETRTGPHFIKFVGPAATVAKWDASFQTFLRELGEK